MRTLASFLAAALAALALSAPAAEPTRALTGQVVCSGCWDEADRKTTPYGTKADLKCAAACARKGVTSSLAVAEGSGFKLYELQAGRFTPKGKGWVSYAGKKVEARGEVSAKDGKSVLSVDTLKVLEEEKR